MDPKLFHDRDPQSPLSQERLRRLGTKLINFQQPYFVKETDGEVYSKGIDEDGFAFSVLSLNPDTLRNICSGKTDDIQGGSIKYYDSGYQLIEGEQVTSAVVLSAQVYDPGRELYQELQYEVAFSDYKIMGTARLIDDFDVDPKVVGFRPLDDKDIQLVYNYIRMQQGEIRVSE